MTVDCQFLARDARTRAGGEKQRQAGDVLGINQGLERSGLHHLLVYLGFATPGFERFCGDHAVYALPGYRARANAVHPHPRRAQLLRQRDPPWTTY